MNNSDLHGTLALVRPDLQNDPAKQQGQVGVITYIDNSEKAYMSFPKGGEGIYEPSDLFQLKDTDFFELFKQSNDGAVNLKDYKDIFRIDLLTKLGRSTDLLAALEIAGENRNIWDKVLDSVDSKMTHQQTYAMAR